MSRRAYEQSARRTGRQHSSPGAGAQYQHFSEMAREQLASGSAHPRSAADRALLERIAQGEQPDTLRTWPTLPPRSPFQPKNIEWSDRDMPKQKAAAKGPLPEFETL